MSYITHCGCEWTLCETILITIFRKTFAKLHIDTLVVRLLLHSTQKQYPCLYVVWFISAYESWEVCFTLRYTNVILYLYVVLPWYWWSAKDRKVLGIYTNKSKEVNDSSCKQQQLKIPRFKRRFHRWAAGLWFWIQLLWGCSFQSVFLIARRSLWSAERFLLTVVSEWTPPKIWWFTSYAI